jgi:hypothetical protein
VEFEATKATTNGLKAGDSGSFFRAAQVTPERRTPWSKKKAAEVMFSGFVVENVFGNESAPAPSPADRRLKLRHTA